jgi:hypothetical protein
MKTVEPHITLTEAQAWEFAQFLKRVSFSEYRTNATSEAEAYHMRGRGHPPCFRRAGLRLTVARKEARAAARASSAHSVLDRRGR